MTISMPGLRPLAVSALFIGGIAIAGDDYPDPVQCKNWCKSTYASCRTEGKHSCEDLRQACLQDCRPGRTPQLFGAIAYDEKTKAFGYSINYRTRDEADHRALSRCKTPQRACQVVVRFTDGCAALVVDKQSRTWGWGISGLSKDEAELNAMSGCTEHGGKDCGVRVSTCNGASPTLQRQSP